ncbi:MAG: hypothetical protein IJL25_09625 [Clostridia bacterium]|nr:hypothetical protein [Clostridia bacterium]
MKLKGAAKNMSPKIPVILAAVLGGALVLLRAYQTLSLIDPETGFFRANAGITVPLFYILAVGLALLTPAACYLCPLSKAEYIAAAKRPLHAVACLLFAVAVLGDSISLFTSGAVNDVSQSSVRHILSQNNGRLVNATAVLGVIAAITLALCAVSFFAGKELIKKAKVLYLAPALWALCKTMSYFTINASYLNNTSLLVCIFADVFLMVFFFEYARKVTGIAGDGNSAVYLGTALVCAFLQLSAGVTGLLGVLPGREEILHAPFAFYRPAAALFCLTAVALLLKNTVPDYVPAGETVETHPLEPAPEAPAPEVTAPEAPAPDAAVPENADEA